MLPNHTPLPVFTWVLGGMSWKIGIVLSMYLEWMHIENCITNAKNCIYLHNVSTENGFLLGKCHSLQWDCVGIARLQSTRIICPLIKRLTVLGTSLFSSWRDCSEIRGVSTAVWLLDKADLLVQPHIPQITVYQRSCIQAWPWMQALDPGGKRNSEV